MGSRRILIVDDNPDQVQMLVVLLRAREEAVEYATNSFYALALAKEFRPQFVLLDIAMPRLDGYQMLERLRRDFKGARYIAISGRGDDESRQRSLNAGFEDYLVKPIEFSAVEKIIDA